MLLRVLLLASVACSTITLPAIAQQTAPKNEETAAIDESGDQRVHPLEDIVVTATRRQTDLQDTPISVEVYSGEDILDRGIANVTDLARVDTSVNLANAGGHPALSVRGITSSNGTETGEPAVSVSVDGVFNLRGYSLTSSLYDVARVEILRGPQGTLFGRNTTGGLLNVITNRPSSEFAASATLDLGNHDRTDLQGFLNLPLSDTLSARASFSSRSRDGFINAPPLDQRVDDEQSDSGRLQLLWTPTDDFTAWFSAQRGVEGGAGTASEFHPFLYPPGTALLPDGRPVAPGVEPLHGFPPNLSGGDSYTVYSIAAQDIETTDLKWSIEIADLFGDATLTYLGGYNEIDYSKGVPTLYRGFPAVFTRRENPETWSHELRLASSDAGRFIWQVGTFAFEEKSGLLTDLVRDPGASTETQMYEFNTPDIEATSYAVFGQASVRLTDALTFTAGARQTWDEKSRDGTFFLRPALTGAPVSIPISQFGEAESDKLTWQVTLDYQVSDDGFLYAKGSTGYKSGGFTGSSQYAPETVTSYELGSKNRFLENRAQLNVVGYFMQFKDQQVNQYIDVSGAVQAVTTNAGESEIYGVETELDVQLDGIGMLGLNVNYTHVEYLDFVTTAPWSSAPVFISVDLAGNALPYAPEWSVSAQWDKTWGYAWGGYISTMLNGRYQTESYSDPNNFANQRTDGYGIVDAVLTYYSGDEDWSIQLYANNVLDEVPLTGGEVYPFGAYAFSYLPPRTYGLRFTTSF